MEVLTHSWVRQVHLTSFGGSIRAVPACCVSAVTPAGVLRRLFAKLLSKAFLSACWRDSSAALAPRRAPAERDVGRLQRYGVPLRLQPLSRGARPPGPRRPLTARAAARACAHPPRQARVTDPRAPPLPPRLLPLQEQVPRSTPAEAARDTGQAL